jgi:hypothetical protein
MKTISVSLLNVALAATFSVAVFAQTRQTGYHTVACFKVKADKGAQFSKFMSDESHKLAQGRVDDGEITHWYLLRAVLPQGSEVACDYISIAFFPGTPHVLGTQELLAAIKKSGMSITPEDYLSHRNAVSTLVSVSLFQNDMSAGSPTKGDYFHVSYLKTANREDFVDWDKRVWLPVHELLIKDGIETGWSINTQVLPGGAEQPFQAVAIAVFPSMDAFLLRDSKIVDEFKKTHPDMDVGTTREQFGKFMEQFAKLRTVQNVQLYQLEDSITK